MKVVLLHDWLTGFRGGERVLEVFCEMFPDAPLYTLVHKLGSVPDSIENRKIQTSFLDKVPGIHSQYRKFLPMFPAASESLKIIEQADLVLSSSHCVIKGVKKPTGSKHLCYIHSPMRYLYDQYENYFGANAPWYQRYGMKLFHNSLINWDLESNKNVDHFVANSSFVKQRIQKYYNLDSTIVHPFVDLEDFDKNTFDLAREDFYLMVSAFAPNKKVDTAVRAFNELGHQLKIIGGGQQEAELKELANKNVEFLGNLSRDEVIDHFKRARGFVFPGVEDFGITPLESLASGCPVIAFKTGGVLETLNDDVAQYYEDPSVEGLKAAIEKFELRSFERELLKKRAQEFSKERFIKEIEAEINNLF